MRKLYRRSTVHPTPLFVSEHVLSFLPASILTLAVALSPVEREVLAYLISCSSDSFSNRSRKSNHQTAAAGDIGGAKGDCDHAPCFDCNCFRCYMSYWVKWDSSPNRQLIHEIIDSFENSLMKESKKEKNKRERRKGKSVTVIDISLGIMDVPNSSGTSVVTREDSRFCESNAAAKDVSGDTGGGGRDDGDNTEGEEMGKGSVRRFVSFLGERISNFWG